jgi:hypothetical protein
VRLPSGTIRLVKHLVLGALTGALMLLLFLAAVFPLIRVRMDDPIAECAVKYEERKTALVDARWSWLPPGWACRFADGPDGRVP